MRVCKHVARGWHPCGGASSPSAGGSKSGRATPVRSGDVALLSAEWHLRGTGPDGAPVKMGGKTNEVVRRHGTVDSSLSLTTHPGRIKPALAC